VGNGQMIHYAGWFHSADGLIEEVPLEQFSKGRAFVTGRIPVDYKSGEQIVRRARSRLGERSYDLSRTIVNTCAAGVISGRPGASRPRRLLRPRSSSGARCRNCEPIWGAANQPVCSSLLAARVRTNKGRTHEDCLG
jgi:hypothetical protein